MFIKILEKLTGGSDLSVEEAGDMMDFIISGEAEDVQIAAYLTALRCKGETENEILGSCHSIRRHCKGIPANSSLLVDTCGTGGDSHGTFNISTTSAFVVAGAGVPVAKHGNRAVSSRAGSADILVELDINIQVRPQDANNVLKNTGLVFLFAPLYHPALAHAVPVRKVLGLRTIFNILGPLNNPLGVKKQILGVFDSSLTETMAGVLASLGSTHVLVVCGNDNLDEISLTGETLVTELKNERFHTYTITPEKYGFKRVGINALRGDDVTENARICINVLQGDKGPARDVVLLNAGAAIYVSGKVSDIAEGISLAEKSIDSGAAFNVLEILRKLDFRSQESENRGKGA